MSVDFGEKKESARDRLLRIMSDLEWHPWRELVSVGGHRFSSRLRELRRLGYKMEDEEPSEGDGKWYRLLSLERGEPAPKFVRVPFTPEDAADLLDRLGSSMTFTARIALHHAYQSYLANAEKL
jgi:hypothetical protein